jgi:hypothetical protein
MLSIAPQLSQVIQENAGFLCDKAVMLGVVIKEKLSTSAYDSLDMLLF